MENAPPEVKPLSCADRKALTFVSHYTTIYLALCGLVHIGTLLHWLRFEQLVALLGFGMLPFFPTIPLIFGYNSMSGQVVNSIMRRSPKWMRWGTVIQFVYFPLLMIWHGLSRPEQGSPDMDRIISIYAAQMFSVGMSFFALCCLRLIYWRLNPESPETNG